MLEKIYIDNPRYILVNIQKAIEHCPFKSDLPIKHVVSIVVLVYQRVVVFPMFFLGWVKKPENTMP